MLGLKVNKKLLQKYLSTVSGKPVTLRDITNIQVKLNASSNGNSLEALVKHLRQIEGT